MLLSILLRFQLNFSFEVHPQTPELKTDG